MYVCVCTYAFVYMYVYIYINIHIHIDMYMYNDRPFSKAKENLKNDKNASLHDGNTCVEKIIN